MNKTNNTPGIFLKTGLKACVLVLIFILSSCSEMLTSNPNRPPISLMEQSDYTLYPGIEQLLDLSDSVDADNQTLTYKWEVITEPSENAARLVVDTTDSSKAVFSSEIPGQYKLLAAVVDEYNLQDDTFVTITVTHNAPTALAGTGAVRYPGVPVTLSASAEDDDPDGPESMTYSWEVVSQPALNSEYFLSDGTTLTPTFTTSFYAVGETDYVTVPSYLGDYTLRLTATDEWGLTGTSDVTITVANAAPGADAGVDSIGAIDADDPLTLTGSGGGAEETSRRNTWQYRWSVTDQPEGSALSLSNTDWTNPSDPDSTNTAVADFTPETSGSDAKPGEGVYTLALEVRDEYGATSTDSMIVATSGNTTPVVGAPLITASDGMFGDGSSGAPYRDDDTSGSDDSNDTVNLDGVIATNAEDDTMTVTWQLHSLPTGVEQLRFRVDGGGDQLYSPGDTLKSQDVVDGLEADFELDIAPATNLTGAFVNTDSTKDDASSYPDADWDVAISIIANDGAVSSDPEVQYFDFYTPTP
ncbi:hypothetical protein EXM22_13560 [Oceanispirochaeta crateris]|uniref:PKD domain-containing protein n=1 Tax=Oceanispirochaeta crateris TaxID=2518645 RepID=A0A5C1QPM5_9SPIO|nr:hypothetical protein [Oceanispirochaeta crateris]QEN08970.1 hypothetical protein EXM22_13560 [Oceanispirochaeta crateris]